MQQFTIRDIEHLTGIKSHTLRIWEQRYDFFSSKRKESKHRYYDNEDLKQLLRIAFLYHSGWKVSRIASQSPEEITEHVRSATVGAENVAAFINQLLEAAIDFNEHAFVTHLNSIIDTIGFERCILDVCYPYLTKVGLLWSTNNVIPAQEHFSSYIIQNKIIVETEKSLLQKAVAPEIVLFCPQGEFHELPLLFINYVMKKNGWGTVFLGANVKIRELAPVVAAGNIQYIYLHLITNFTGYAADDYLEEVCTSFPGQKIIASGGGIHEVQRTFVNLTVLKSDKEILNFIRGKPLLR